MKRTNKFVTNVMKKGLTRPSVLEQINRAGVKFLTPLSLEQIYELIVEEAKKLVKAEYGSVFLFEAKRLKRVYASLPMLYKIKPKKGGLVYNAIITRQPSVLDIQDISKIHKAIRKMGIKSIVVIPLSYHNATIGALTIESTKKEHFNRRELETLNVFGSMATLAIRKTQSYNETRRALENRDLFISMAAHELRTPLTTMSVYIQLLKNQLMKSPKSRQLQLLEELSWEGARLKNLIDELLVISRIKTGALSYTFGECSLREVIQRSLTAFLLSNPERQVSLDDKGPKLDAIVGDFDKLVQVFINILDNAAKFSPRGCVITVTIGFVKENFVVTVADQGRGIPQKDLPYIFEGFYQGKTDSDNKGMGLGLYLCKSIIEKHRGNIRIKSRVGVGTKVLVSLPQVKIGKTAVPS